jgi:hypothetical protein
MISTTQSLQHVHQSHLLDVKVQQDDGFDFLNEMMTCVVVVVSVSTSGTSGECRSLAVSAAGADRQCSAIRTYCNSVQYQNTGSSYFFYPLTLNPQRNLGFTSFRHPK